jgi:hypothetical protein
MFKVPERYLGQQSEARPPTGVASTVLLGVQNLAVGSLVEMPMWHLLASLSSPP